ncbi:MAG: beta strand repeat-containing protein [Chakrabartia sp.]
MQGAATAEGQAGTALQTVISDLLAARNVVTSITIDAVATDNLISAAEATGLVVRGAVGEGATAVALRFGDRTVQAVLSGSQWSYAMTADDITALGADGVKQITAEASFGAGGQASASRVVALRITPPQNPVIDMISGDDRVNASEKAEPVIVSGTGEAGTTITLWTEGGFSKTTKVGLNGQWSVELQASDLNFEDRRTLKAVATDAFGNQSGPAQRDLTVDTIAPGAPTILPIGTNDKIGPNEKTSGFEIRGRAEAFASVTLSFNNVDYQAKADRDGNWAVTIFASNVPTDANYPVVARQTDLAGNAGPVSEARILTVDALPPPPPRITSISGSDLLINAVERARGVIVSGTTEIGTTVRVTWAGQTVEAIVDQDGSWYARFLSTNIPLTGTHNITAIAYDASNNGSAQASLANVTVDLSTPIPTYEAVATDNVINAVERAQGITLRGAAGSSELGATLTVRLTGANGYSFSKSITVLNADGSWELTISADQLPQTNMSVDIALTARDLAGNTATAPVRTIAVDLTSPGALSLELRSDTNIADDGITADGTLLVRGIEGDSTWEYSLNNGAWTQGLNNSLVLPDGTYADGAIRIRQRDPAGNVSETTTYSGALTVDHIAPQALSLRLRNDNGAFRNDNISNDGTVSFGQVETGAVIQYYDGLNWVALTNGSLVLDAGTYRAGSIRVRQVDAAGNISTETTNASDWVIDKAAPAAITPTLVQDTGTDAHDGITSDGTISVGTLEANAVFQYSVDSGQTWQTVSSGSKFVLDAGRTYAANTILVRQVDLAGNAGASTAYGEDLQVLAALSDVPSFQLTADNGPSATDNISNNGQIDVSLSSSAVRWEYSVNGGAWQAGSGTSFTLSEGTYAAGSIKVRQFDIAGNQSVAGTNATYSIVIDKTAPGQPLVSFTDTGTVGDNYTGNNQISVTLSADAAYWDYSTNGGTSWTRGGTATGTFTLADGSYTAGQVRVRQGDTAGNISADQALGALTIDTAATAPTITWPTDGGSSSTDGVTNATRISLSGLEQGATWTYKLKGSISDPQTGSYFDLPEGRYAIGDIVIELTDRAGNKVSVSNTKAWTIDTTLATPTLSLDADSGSNGADGVTNNGKVNVANLDSGGTWQYSLNGGGSWSDSFLGTQTSFTLDAGTYSANSIIVRQFDSAGNVRTSAALSSSDVVIDKTGPAAVSLAIQDIGTSTTDGLTANSFVTVNDQESGASFRYNITAGHPDSGWVTVTGTGFSLPAGSYSANDIWVQPIDKAGNFGPITKYASGIVVELTAPSSPTVTLYEDNGTSNSDGVTTNGQMTVANMEAGAVLQYKDSDSDTWTSVYPTDLNSTITSFTMPTGKSFAANHLLFRQVDAAGNASAAVVYGPSLSISSTSQPPSVTMASDTGTSPSDNLTNDGTFTISGLDIGASWQYTTNGLNAVPTWTSPTDSASRSITLPEGNYASGQIGFRQVLNGSYGDPYWLNTSLKIDRTAPIIDMDGIPANGVTGYSATITNTSWTYIADRSAALTEANGIDRVTLKISGLRDASDEQLKIDSANITLGGQTLAVLLADGSNLNGGTASFTLNGVSWSVSYDATNGFIFKALTSGTVISTTAAQDLIRALQYANADTTPSEGVRVFSFSTVDAAGNSVAAPAIAHMVFNAATPTIAATAVTPVYANANRTHAAILARERGFC